MSTDSFRQYMMANAVRGTSFWELYFSPSMMDEAKWQVTADVLTFAEENEDILQHAKIFGNAPRTGSVYGFSSWNKDEGIISFRNPTSQEKTYTLKLDELVGVTKAVQNVHQIQILPYKSSIGDETVSYNDEITVTLKPYEELIYQFTNTKNDAPKIVYAKVIDENTVRVKFDQRIEDTNVYKINSKPVTANLMDDYRTVELTVSESMNEGDDVAVEINGVNSINGAAMKDQISLTYYKDDVIVKVNDKSDLINSQDVKETVYNRNGVNFIELDKSKFELFSDKSLDKTTKDFTISMIVQTGSQDATILQNNGNMTLSIDQDGFITYTDKDIQLSSRQEVTTVVEKAHETFGTEEYVPTTSETVIKGQVNDGNKHLITVVRELNGMVKMYVDGELASSAYSDGK